MQPAFTDNYNIGNQIASMRTAWLELSNKGYSVLEVRAKSSGEMANLLIDREFDECSYEVKQLADRKIGWVARWGCIIYWHIPV